MDLSNLMMLWNFLLAIHIAYADVIREDGYHNYEGQFTVKNKGRMLRVLMSFRNVEMVECALHCVRHLRCRTFNYRHGRKDCELTDEDFYEMDVDTITHGWHNYGTPKRVNGGWSSWIYFTECTKTCGGGTRDQYRDCDSPRPAHGGADCYERMIRRVKCNIHGCPVNGNWSSWRNYTECKKTCGDGTLEQYRDCDSPRPAHGGAGCTGTGMRTVECNTKECPVVNVALGKVATQSSTEEDKHKWSASKVVDGDTGTCCFTEDDKNQWWEVDIGEVRVIKKINLNANVDSGSNKGLLVEARIKKAQEWTLCKDIGDVKNRITEFECERQSIHAQFLRIRSTKECSLWLFEVEIFAS